jgi:hypothetical protein
VYDDLRYHQAYRMFIGLDHGTAWSPMQCVRLLQACAHPLLRGCIDDALASVPQHLFESVHRPAARRTGTRAANCRRMFIVLTHAPLTMAQRSLPG